MSRSVFTFGLLCLLVTSLTALPTDDFANELKDSNTLDDTTGNNEKAPVAINEAPGPLSESNDNADNAQNDDDDEDDDTSLKDDSAALNDGGSQSNSAPSQSKSDGNSGTTNSDKNAGQDKTEKGAAKGGKETTINSLRGFITVRNNVLQAHINRMIKSHLRNEPITKMLMFSVTSSRSRRYIRIQHINGNTFSLGRQLALLDITTDKSAAGNSILAYRPNYSALHSSQHAAIFVNMEKVFPCIRRISNLGPICKMFTAEEDGFNNGLSLIEAGDVGNNLKIFGSNIATYGFGFKTCRTLNQFCLPVHYQSTIVCQLPRAYCR